MWPRCRSACYGARLAIAMVETDSQEDKLLDAEAWAEELDAWSRARRGTPEASETAALSRLIRALIKNIRLSIVADGDPEDRRYLVEELDMTIAQAQTIAMGSGPKKSTKTGGSIPPTLMRQQSIDISDETPPAVASGAPRTRTAQSISDLDFPAVKATTRPMKREED